jgi:hypothetical protein
MNTYDPADYIVYVRMDRTLSPDPLPVPSARPAHRLPRGYANQSPGTRLRSTTARSARSSLEAAARGRAQARA